MILWRVVEPLASGIYEVKTECRAAQALKITPAGRILADTTSPLEQASGFPQFGNWSLARE